VNSLFVSNNISLFTRHLSALCGLVTAGVLRLSR